jgi:hypothetical protein
MTKKREKTTSYHARLTLLPCRPEITNRLVHYIWRRLPLVIRDPNLILTLTEVMRARALRPLRRRAYRVLSGLFGRERTARLCS